MVHNLEVHHEQELSSLPHSLHQLTMLSPLFESILPERRHDITSVLQKPALKGGTFIYFNHKKKLLWSHQINHG